MLIGFYRSIFDFLLISSTLVLAFIIFFLPETHRAIAGNGAIRLRGVYRPIFQNFRREPDYLIEQNPNFKLPKVSFFTIIEPLRILLEKDAFVTLLFGGIVHTVWSMVFSSTTPLFVEHYDLGQLLIGCAFLPNGMCITFKQKEHKLISSKVLDVFLARTSRAALWTETTKLLKDATSKKITWKKAEVSIKKTVPIIFQSSVHECETFGGF
jgi:hypothetical protein